MEFGQENCAMLIIRSRKTLITEGIEQANQERIRTLRKKENCKHLEILEAETIKQVDMKKKKMIILDERERFLKPSSAIGISSGLFHFVRYSVPFLKWKREELNEIDLRTRKLMTMYNVLHTRDDIDIIYVSRKEGESEKFSIEDSVDASIRELETSFRRAKKD